MARRSTVSYCDYCSRPEYFAQFTWHYPGLDLRDFPQMKIQVEDEEALDFLTGCIDPSPERKERSRKQVPEMWSSLSNGDLFEVGLTFAGMLNVDCWAPRQRVSRQAKAGEGWDWLTPQMLSLGGRAIMGGQHGFEEFGDILRREAEDKPRERKYGKWAEIGPLAIIDPSLCDDAKKILRQAAETYITARSDPDMQPLPRLMEKYGIYPERLRALADSGLIATEKMDTVKRGPVLMSDAAREPLIYQMKNSISERHAAPKIGVHRAHLEELEKRGLLERVEGAVLKLLEAETCYTRGSVYAMKKNISKHVKRGAPQDCLQLRVAVRACNVRSVPWARIVQAILDERLEVFRIKSDRSLPSPANSLANSLAVRDARVLASLIQQDGADSPAWIGNTAASEILGVNEGAVWRLVKSGALKKHGNAPLYSQFKRSEVERLNGQMIFTPEIARSGRFQTYREASGWLKQQRIAPRLELKRGGWKAYARAEVERAVQRRIDALQRKTAPEPRPAETRYGPETPQGKLAAAQELSNASKVGLATAASILGCTIFAVQRLAATGHLNSTGEITPFSRTEVETLAKRFVFIPEIMRLSGYMSYVRVTNWLKIAGIEPHSLLTDNGIPMFDRAAVEEQVARSYFVCSAAHPLWIKRSLLAMVACGTSVHQASVAFGISYATAKTWARNEGTRRGVAAIRRGSWRIQEPPDPGTARPGWDCVKRDCGARPFRC